MDIDGGTHVVAVIGATALVATLTTSTVQAQEDDLGGGRIGLDAPRHLTFSPTGRAVRGRGGERRTICLRRAPARRVLPRLHRRRHEGRDDGPDDAGRQRAAVDRHPRRADSVHRTSPSPATRRSCSASGSAAADEFRAELGDDAALLGTLVTGRLGRGRRLVVRRRRGQRSGRQPGRHRHRQQPGRPAAPWLQLLVADAGGNAVVQTSRSGRFDTVAVLPPGSALAPPFLGLPPGTQIPTDAVPTSVVRGRDGAYYISQLTGFPFEQGDANIWRVVPGRAPTVYASGLTNVTDLAFARDGSLYAVEISSDGLLDGPDRRARQGHARGKSARNRRRRPVRPLRLGARP